MPVMSFGQHTLHTHINLTMVEILLLLQLNNGECLLPSDLTSTAKHLHTSPRVAALLGHAKLTRMLLYTAHRLEDIDA